MQQKSYQKSKNPRSTLCQVLGSILEMEEQETRIDEPRDEETNEYAEGSPPEK